MNPFRLRQTFGSSSGKAEGYASVLGFRSPDELLINPGVGLVWELDRWRIAEDGPATRIGSFSFAASNTRSAVLVGDRAATFGPPNLVQLWDLEAPGDVPVWSTALPGEGSPGMLVLCGDAVVASTAEGDLFRIALENGAFERLAGGRGSGGTVASNGSRLAVGTSSGVVVFDADGSADPVPIDADGWWALALAPSGVLVAASGHPASIEIVRPGGRRERIRRSVVHRGLFASATDDRVLCCHGTGRDGGLSILHLGADPARLEAVPGAEASWASFAPDGRSVVFVEQRGATYRVGIARPGEVREPPIQLGDVVGIERIDGGALIACDLDRIVRCDPVTGSWEPLRIQPPLQEIDVLGQANGALYAGGSHRGEQPCGLFALSRDERWEPIVPPELPGGDEDEDEDEDREWCPRDLPRQLALAADGTAALVGLCVETRGYMNVELWRRDAADGAFVQGTSLSDESVDHANRLAISADGASFVYPTVDEVVVVGRTGEIARLASRSLGPAAIRGDTAALGVDGGLVCIDLRTGRRTRSPCRARELAFLDDDHLVTVRRCRERSGDRSRLELSIVRVDDGSVAGVETLDVPGEPTCVRVVRDPAQLLVGTSFGTVHVLDVVPGWTALERPAPPSVGCAVDVVGGRFAGAKGTVTAIDGDRVSVRIVLFGRDLEITVDRSDVLAEG